MCLSIKTRLWDFACHCWADRHDFRNRENRGKACSQDTELTKSPTSVLPGFWLRHSQLWTGTAHSSSALQPKLLMLLPKRAISSTSTCMAPQEVSHTTASFWGERPFSPLRAWCCVTMSSTSRSLALCWVTSPLATQEVPSKAHQSCRRRESIETLPVPLHHTFLRPPSSSILWFCDHLLFTYNNLAVSHRVI